MPASMSPRLPLLSTEQLLPPQASSSSSSSSQNFWTNKQSESPTSITSNTTSDSRGTATDALYFDIGGGGGGTGAEASRGSNQHRANSAAADMSTMNAAPVRSTSQRRRQSAQAHLEGTATPDIGNEDKDKGAMYFGANDKQGEGAREGRRGQQRSSDKAGIRDEAGIQDRGKKKEGDDHDDDDDDEEEEDDDLVAIRGGHEDDGSDGQDGYRRVRGAGGADYASQAAQRKAFWSKAVVNLALIASWYCFSTLMNLYNSWLFSKKHYHFSYPLFVTSIHMVVQFGLSSSLMFFFANNPRIVPRRRNGKRARPDGRDWLSKVVPCALATALDIGLSNLSLKTITLTFYTMCKSSNLAFVLFFAFLFGLEKLRVSLIGIIALITVGVIMMVAAETQFVLEGAVEVLTASAMGGLRWALTQLLLDRENIGMNNPIATIFWLSPVMALAMFCVSLIVEDWPTMVNGPFFEGLGRSLKTVVLMVLPGFIAFFMNLSEFALIQRTSVVTLSVAGIFKEVLTIFVSSTIFGDELTAINVTGLCVALTGIGLYNWLKYRILTGRPFDGSSNNLANTTMTSADRSRGAGYTHLANGPSSSSAAGPAAAVAAAATASSSFFFKGRRRDDKEDDGNDVLFDEGEQRYQSGSSSLAMSEREEGSSTRNTSPALRTHGLPSSSSQPPMTEAERQRLAKREEEADLFGWEHSGTTTTGNGYVEDSGSETE